MCGQLKYALMKFNGNLENKNNKTTTTKQNHHQQQKPQQNQTKQTHL